MDDRGKNHDPGRVVPKGSFSCLDGWSSCCLDSWRLKKQQPPFNGSELENFTDDLTDRPRLSQRRAWPRRTNPEGWYREANESCTRRVRCFGANISSAVDRESIPLSIFVVK